MFLVPINKIIFCFSPFKKFLQLLVPKIFSIFTLVPKIFSIFTLVPPLK